MTEAKPMYLLFTVLPPGRGRPWMNQLKKWAIFLHLQFSGHGTASSEMMDILGLETTEKDVIISIGTEHSVAAFAADFSENVVYRHRLGGLLVILRPNAINHLLTILTQKRAEELLEQEESEKMSNALSSEYDYSLILAAVNRGFTDEVMQAAKAAGAAGGTVIRGRLADSEQAETEYGMAFRDDKDLLTILTSAANRDAILEAINSSYGLRSPAQTIICSLPVEKAYKI